MRSRRRRIYLEGPWRPVLTLSDYPAPSDTAPPLASQVLSSQKVTLRLVIEVPASPTRQVETLLQQDLDSYEVNEPFRLDSLVGSASMDMIPLLARIRVLRKPAGVTTSTLKDAILVIRYQPRE